MSASDRRDRRWSAIAIVGVALIVVGLLVGIFRLLNLFRHGPGQNYLVQVPVDAFPDGPQLWIVNSSMVVGALLVLIGAVLVAAWVGYRRGRVQARSSS